MIALWFSGRPIAYHRLHPTRMRSGVFAVQLTKLYSSFLSAEQHSALINGVQIGAARLAARSGDDHVLSRGRHTGWHGSLAVQSLPQCAQ